MDELVAQVDQPQIDRRLVVSLVVVRTLDQRYDGSGRQVEFDHDALQVFVVKAAVRTRFAEFRMGAVFEMPGLVDQRAGSPIVAANFSNSSQRCF
jgi:hypothetical protein